MDKAQKKFLKFETFFGNEIVAGTRRLALMNLFLHNIGDIDSDHVMISPNDSLIAASETPLRLCAGQSPLWQEKQHDFH